MIQLTQNERDFVINTLKPYLKKDDWGGIRKKLGTFSSPYSSVSFNGNGNRILMFLLENDIPVLTGLNRIPKRMFAESEISKITIPGTIKTIDEFAFYECKNLSSVIIEDGVERILKGAFCNTSLSSVTLPESIKEIRENAFASTHLQKINIPDSVTDLYKNTFENCPENLVIYANSRKELAPQYRLRVPSDEVEFYTKHLKMKGEEYNAN